MGSSNLKYSNSKFMKPHSSPGISRRRFLTTTAAALALPAIVPGSLFGQNRPSNRINIGIIGWGMQGPGNAQAFMFEEDCRVVAACDLDRNHLQDAVDTIVIDTISDLDRKALEDSGIEVIAAM